MANKVLCRLFFQISVGNRRFCSWNSQNHVMKYNDQFSLTKTHRWATRRFCTGLSDNSDPFIDLKDIIGDNPQDENKLKIMILETEMLRQSGIPVPDNIRKDDWKTLLSIQSKSARRTHLMYLFKTEKSKEANKLKRKLKNEEYQNFLKRREMGDIEESEYSFSKNSLFQRIYETTIGYTHNLRLLYNMPYTQQLILDCSYEQHMTQAESKNTAKQMTYIFADNRIHHDPYDLHVFHQGDQSAVMKQLRKNIPSMDEPHFPMHFHSGSYLDVFPKERLVYLTPDCRNEIINYDHNAIYIIGCIVDRGAIEPLTMAKAKKEGIKMAKLPIDRFLEWGTGAKKTLTLNQIVKIMLDARNGSDWNHAFRHIPRRKLASVQLEGQLKKIQRSQGHYYDRIMEIDSIKSSRKQQQPTEQFKMSKDELKKYAEQKVILKEKKLPMRRLRGDDSDFMF